MNREINSVINGRIELRRSGDILVDTNGVERFIPRQLPFEHNGFELDGNGTARIKKFGFVFECDTNRYCTVWREE